MKILLVDDHVLFRDGLKFVLRQLADVVDIRECGSCEDAYQLMETDDGFDLILLDVDLPGISGMDGLQGFRRLDPSAPIVFLSGSDDYNLIKRALELGVMGYIPKTLSSEIMIQALQLILKGGRYVPDNVLYGADHHSRSKVVLTTRQSEILRLISQGKSNKEIAQNLGIADNTVRVHISAIFQILKVNNRTEAAFAALQDGLVSPY
ncbi:response regulator transcription factor [Paremcibacter congregatus]|uniref:response regulator transcription factor n=1 Tax=Paremcibacter congregatus TaxID=2043170 RepID=UPI0030EF6042|tara:strand:- start:14573 stop:15193 length:621 start_codon:yes stop_codon:yes gene_type:complete